MKLTCYPKVKRLSLLSIEPKTLPISEFLNNQPYDGVFNEKNSILKASSSSSQSTTLQWLVKDWLIVKRSSRSIWRPPNIKALDYIYVAKLEPTSYT